MKHTSRAPTPQGLWDLKEIAISAVCFLRDGGPLFWLGLAMVLFGMLLDGSIE